jgi:hypothetical protein
MSPNSLLFPVYPPFFFPGPCSSRPWPGALPRPWRAPVRRPCPVLARLPRLACRPRPSARPRPGLPCPASRARPGAAPSLPRPWRSLPRRAAPSWRTAPSRRVRLAQPQLTPVHGAAWRGCGQVRARPLPRSSVAGHGVARPRRPVACSPWHGVAWSSARRAHGAWPGARPARARCLGPRRGASPAQRALAPPRLGTVRGPACGRGAPRGAALPRLVPARRGPIALCPVPASARLSPLDAAPCPDAASPWRGPGPALARRGPCAVWPRPGAASARAAAVPLRSTARARLGSGVCATRSRRVSAALRVRVLAWCAQCFGVARRAFGATRSALSRATCSSTPRRARLTLATRLPLSVYSMRSDHVIYINEMETQLRN